MISRLRKQRISRSGNVKSAGSIFTIAHHEGTPLTPVLKVSGIEIIRTVRLEKSDSKENVIPSSKVTDEVLYLFPPKDLNLPSLAFSDSIAYFRAMEIFGGYKGVGVFQYRRLLAIWSKSEKPVQHSYRILYRYLLAVLAKQFKLRMQGKEKVWVGNPLSVFSLESQYSENCLPTLNLLISLRDEFRHALRERFGDLVEHIDPKKFYWSSLYLGPSKYVIEFSEALKATFQRSQDLRVSENLDTYQSRWVGFVVERLFSDYVQCLILREPDLVETCPVIQLNGLPSITSFIRRTIKRFSLQKSSSSTSALNS